MNKVEFINVMVVEFGLSKVDFKKVFEVFFFLVIKVLLVGDKIFLVGFGIFFVVERLVRMGINFFIKKVIEIFVKKVVKFKLGVELIDVIK